VRFLRDEGLSDAFADGLHVVAPNAAPIIEYKLRTAAKERGWCAAQPLEDGRAANV
jgi:hypothetical protein